MTTVRKFMFETDFDAVPGVESPSAARAAAKAKATSAKAAEAAAAAAAAEPEPAPPPEPTFTETEMTAATDKARNEGTQNGEAKGRAAAMAGIEQRTAATLAEIAAQIAEMKASAVSDREAILGDASSLALAILRKMLPEYTRRGGLAEIEAVLSDCLQDQRREARLTVRVSPEQLPALEARIAALSSDAGFDGRLILVADERLEAADCSVEWTDGGLERHANAIWAEISAALDRCLNLQGIAAPVDLAAPAAANAAPEAPAAADAATAQAANDGPAMPADTTTDTTTTESSDLAATSEAEIMRSE